MTDQTPLFELELPQREELTEALELLEKMNRIGLPGLLR